MTIELQTNATAPEGASQKMTDIQHPGTSPTNSK